MMKRAVVSVLVMLCAWAVSGCQCCRGPSESEARLRGRRELVLETLRRFREHDPEPVAWWLRPYYEEMVDILSVENGRTIACILGEHGVLYAVPRLEPFLRTEKGEKRLLIAAYTYMLSAYIHAESQEILEEYERKSPVDEYWRTIGPPGTVGWTISAALHPHDDVQAWADEGVSRALGIDVATWRSLSLDEKRRRLRKGPPPPSTEGKEVVPHPGTSLKERVWSER